ncbi:MAG: hypothetical protein Q9185_003536 [Variospora sp. 1 TL-2023]
MSVDDLKRHETQSTIHTNEKLVGQSGQHYLIERVLQSKEYVGNQKFVVKNILAEYKYYQDMQRALHGSRYLRLLQDTIPDRSMFVYKYLNDHLLFLAQKDLPLLLTKRILKDTLRGLAELHHENIVHTEALPEGESALGRVLELQISYFADWESLEGLLRHLGDSPWCQVLEILRGGFNKQNPREPFVRWNIEPLDADLKDLIGGLTNFDPAKRLTADEALSHNWFHDV